MHVVFACRDTARTETRTAAHSRQRKQTRGLGRDRDALPAATPGVGAAGLELGAGTGASKADRLRGDLEPSGFTLRGSALGPWKQDPMMTQKYKSSCAKGPALQQRVQTEAVKAC